MKIYFECNQIGDIKDGSNVLIYGAGRLGEELVNDILYSDRIKILAVVDRHPEHKIAGLTIPCIIPDDILKFSFDYIIIALQDRSSIEQVKSYLLDIGINENRIVYQKYDRQDDGSIFEYKKLLERFVQSKERKIIIFKVPEHGNTGDYAIAMAEKIFFARYFGENVLTITSDEWRVASDRIKHLVTHDDIIVMNGGGYIGDLWVGEQDSYMSIVEAFPENKIFFMPNTLTYRENDFENKEYFLNHMKWFSEQKNTYVFFRDKRSYEIFSRYCNRTRLFPDMVFSMSLPNSNQNSNGKCLLCFRNDDEKCGEVSDVVKDELTKHGVSFDEFDIYMKRFVLQQNGEHLVEYVSNLFSEYDAIITDRLHGMIIAVISNVPCIVFDNSTKKNSGVFEWIRNKGWAVFLRDGQACQIFKFIKYAKDQKREAGEYYPLREQFDKMASFMREVAWERAN